MASVPNPLVEAAFSKAIRDFKKTFNNDKLYGEIWKTKSIEEVYALTDTLQEEWAKKGKLKYLSRMKPFLEGLRQYTGAIDTFVQAKPDILALIWGPIKLLIQWTSCLTQSIDALAKITAEIGKLLPEFKEMITMFNKNQLIWDVLELFFQDILDFYTVCLKFFGMNRWKYLFEAVWPQQKEKIEVVMDHIERHTALMRNEVRLEHIREEHNARIRALEHFEETQRNKRLLEYNIIKTDLSPQPYDRRLDDIRGRHCNGTGEWLLKDDTFKNWLQGSDTANKILWLQGIPGAGKTFLACTAIDMAMSLRRTTAFAFLSHVHSASTSALSVIHSLIIQLSSKSEGLQAVLCQSAQDKLKHNLDAAINIFKSLLSCAGPVSIVIDGVDEIEGIERVRLLRQLVEISKSCDEARILFSCRAEDDIQKVLGPVCRTIRVDQRNSGSIQAFIRQWMQDFLSIRNFLPEDEQEIAGLLAPLSSKAKGMFLYAKVVLGSIELLNNMEDIRGELRAPPEDLEEAYGRALRRVNTLNSRLVRKQCRLLLGWISCSPTPMTLRELEQALVVSCGAPDSCQVSSPFNIIQLCGPIVEVIDDFVQFVHFTVKEYFSSTSIEGHIDLREATLSLALCCINYLCQSHHSLALEDEQFQHNVVSGCYRLHGYATERWLDLVECYLKLAQGDTVSSGLLSALERLHDQRGRLELPPDAPDSDVDVDSGGGGDPKTSLEDFKFPPVLLRIKPLSHPVFSLLREAARFRDKCSTSLFKLEDLDIWEVLDPLDTSSISRLLHTSLETFHCQGGSHTTRCYCPKLERHYGKSVYKCGFRGCIYQRQGFLTKRLRDSHHKYHDRPWKCDIQSCHYSGIGFLSKRMRDDHMEFHLQEARSNTAVSTYATDTDDIQPLLFDLVAAGDLMAVKGLLPYCKFLYGSVKDTLQKVASRSGPLALLKLLYVEDKPRDFSNLVSCILAAIDSCNIETLSWLLTHFTSTHYHSERSGIGADVLEQSIKQGASEVLEVVRVWFVAFHRELVENTGDHGLAGAQHASVIQATARCPAREEFLVNLWLTLLQSISGASKQGKRRLGNALQKVAQTTYSVRLARVLIEHGATLDIGGKSEYTPLHQAVRRSCAESAELARFLLYQGADPDAKVSTTRGLKMHEGGRAKRLIRVAAEEKGAKEIGKWLGMSWDELVQKAKEDRAQGIPWPGSAST